jgi:hypothetical protein
MKISTGAAEDHPTPLPIDASHSPGVAPPTPAFPSGTEQGGVRDLAGERLSQLGAAETDIAAAQSYGMAADADRRTGYAADMSPLGASYGDEMDLTGLLPDNALPPASQPGWYGNAGDEPIVG